MKAKIEKISSMNSTIPLTKVSILYWILWDKSYQSIYHLAMIPQINKFHNQQSIEK